MCLWASGDRGQGEPRHNGNEQTGCHPIFGRDSVVRPDRQDHHLIDGLKDPTALQPCLSWPRGTELRAHLLDYIFLVSRRPISSVALPRIPGVRLPVTAMEPQISNSLLRNAVTRGCRASQRTSGFGRLYSAPRGCRSQMSLIVVSTCTAVGWPHFQCAGWDLLEPRR